MGRISPDALPLRCLSGWRRLVAPLLTLAVVVALPTSAGATLTNQERAERGASFLAFAQKPNGSIPAFSPIGSTADAVLAFVATGVGRRDQIRSALAYLRRQVIAGNVVGVGLQGKVVMAASAAKRDPRDFGGENLLKQIRSTIDDDGHMDDAAVFDQALGMLAIESAGVDPSAKVIGWLHDAQCPDGGWAYDAPYAPATDDEHCDDGDSDFFTSDSNTTAYVIQAMEAGGAGSFDHDPFSFFDTVRDGDHGGWAYSTGFLVTDSNSTGLVIQAYASADEPLPSGALDALRDLQYRRCGAWAFTWDGDARTEPDVGATIGAVPGILRTPLPIRGRAGGDVATPVEC